MKKLLSCLLALSMVLSLCAISGVNVFAGSGGTTYYIDSFGGSDENDGTSEESAWKTLYAHSDFVFQPGDSILLKCGGIYAGTFFPSAEGTAESPITISSFGDENDGRPVMLSYEHQPTIYLLNVNGWVIDGLEFTSNDKDGAGVRIEAVNGANHGYWFPVPPAGYPATPDEPDTPVEPDTPDNPDQPSVPAEDKPSPGENFKEFLKGIGHSFAESWQEIKKNAEWILGLEEPESYDMTYWDTLPDDYVISDITVKNCVFHDLSFYKASDITSGCYPIKVNSSGKGSKLENVTLSDIEIYNCAYGIDIDGISREFDPEFFVSAEESYNRNIVLEDITIRNNAYGAILLGAIEGGIVRNCLMQNTCLYDDWYTAPLWTHHCDNVIMENCEVSGTKNWKDGMTVDFDGWTMNSVYQYIYSHDNVCFMRSNNYDNVTENRNNTVRYCLSVDDNMLINMVAFANASKNLPFSERGRFMDNFKFYNNTIVNCAPTIWGIMKNSVVANNIFVGNKNGLSSISINLSLNTKIKNNCFYGMTPPVGAVKSKLCDPGFIGDDITDKNSFKLSSDSKLIGKGIKVEDDMGETDFFGNPLGDTHNIGCYDGSGESEKSNSSERAFTLIGKLILWIKQLFQKWFSL